MDRDRLNALRKRENYDTKADEVFAHSRDSALQRDKGTFSGCSRPRRPRSGWGGLKRWHKLIEERMGDDIAMDVVGSVNMGLSQPSSDIDFVLYLRCRRDVPGNCSACETYQGAERIIREILGEEYKFEILDCIDLNLVEKSIREKNYECETTQRFVAYRSICRPINYRVIAPVEDLLNAGHRVPQGAGGKHPVLFQNICRHIAARPFIQQIRIKAQLHRDQASGFGQEEDPEIPQGGRRDGG